MDAGWMTVMKPASTEIASNHHGDVEVIEGPGRKVSHREDPDTRYKYFEWSDVRTVDRSERASRAS